MWRKLDPAGDAGERVAAGHLKAGFFVDSIDKNSRKIAFEHKFFSALEGSYFRKSAQCDEPVFVLSLGEDEAALPISGIRREFNIDENTADYKMLELVIAGLDYIRVMRIGDDIPQEVLTGDASWEASDKHKDVARYHVFENLMAWATVDNSLEFDDARQLTRLSEYPAMQKKFDETIEEVSIVLGRPNDIVNDLIEQLIAELAYIEALRDRHLELAAMGKKIDTVYRISKKKRGLMAIAGATSRVVATAISEFQNELNAVDAQTSDMIRVLEDFPAHLDIIRDIRNRLYCRAIAMDDFVNAWKQQAGTISSDTPNLIRETFQFFAPRFMQTDDWLLSTQSRKSSARQVEEEVWDPAI